MSKSHSKPSISAQTAAADSAAPKRRESRIPITAIQEALTGHEVLVSDLANKLKIAERDVRLGIDRLRKSKITVVRSALKTFTIPTSAKAAK